MLKGGDIGSALQGLKTATERELPLSELTGKSFLPLNGKETKETKTSHMEKPNCSTPCSPTVN